MSTFNDFSQLKGFRPTPPAPPPTPKPTSPEDRALAGATSSSDYFSSLLGSTQPQKKPPAKTHRTTVVTPATIARVRQEQAEDAQAAREAAFAARENELLEELEAQKAATESIATDLATLRDELKATQTDCEILEQDKASLEQQVKRLEEELTAAREKPVPVVTDVAALEEKDREIERLKALLLEAQSDVRLRDALLDMPVPFSEKFPGEIREHVIEALISANEAADGGGRERRARILEAVLGANPSAGELERRREAVKQIVKEAGSRLDDAAIAELEKLGFRYISGKNHHKLEWAGIRFPLAKTPSDYRACLNSATEICNRAF